MFTDYVKLTTDLERYGVTLPPTVTDALATLAAAKEAAAERPVDDLADEYAAGKINATNVGAKLHKTSSRLAARDAMQAALSAVVNGCHQTIRAGLRDAGEAILTALRAPFDEAAEVVQTAGRYFGSDPTPEQIIAGGVPAAAAHEQLATALSALTQLRSLRVMLADVGYGAPDHTEQDVTWWIAGAADAEALDAARRAYAAPGHAFHNLAAAGFTLRMNTPAEADRLAAGARHASEVREAADREAALRAHRESWAPALAVMAAAGRPSD